jgi:iron complex transport system substrate-binding protein
MLLVFTLLLILAACGSEEKGATPTPNAGGTNASTPSASVSPSASAKADAKPESRVFKDDLGREVTIPTNPKKVIVSDFSSEVLAVGAKPIGAGPNDFKIVFTQKELAGVENIGDPPNVEKILQLGPDLIIVSTVFNEIYPEAVTQLTKISPIIFLSFDQDPIHSLFPKIADVLGKSDEAKKWTAGYEEEAKLAREKVKAAVGNETVSIFRVEKGRLRIYLNRNFGGYMTRTGLQLRAPAAVEAEIAKNKFGSAVQISLEKLPDYAADTMFVIVRSEGDDQAEFKELEKSAIWKNLPAVKNGKVHFLETDKYYGSDIITIRETMKEFVQLLTASGKK